MMKIAFDDHEGPHEVQIRATLGGESVKGGAEICPELD
jgi:hypothetical protein